METHVEHNILYFLGTKDIIRLITTLYKQYISKLLDHKTGPNQKILYGGSHTSKL